MIAVDRRIHKQSWDQIVELNQSLYWKIYNLPFWVKRSIRPDQMLDYDLNNIVFKQLILNAEAWALAIPNWRNIWNRQNFKYRKKRWLETINHYGTLGQLRTSDITRVIREYMTPLIHSLTVMEGIVCSIQNVGVVKLLCCCGETLNLKHILQC